MIITILEGHIDPSKANILQETYKTGLAKIPQQMLQTFLLQNTNDKSLWQIISIWKSREALEEMQRSTATPEGILMFRKAGTEPKLNVFTVPEYAPKK